MFPKDYLKRIGTQLHLEGRRGEEAYLKETVAGHSMSKEHNPHALMPGASEELQEEVLTLLRDSEHYGYLAVAKRVVPVPGSETGDQDGDEAVAFQPPAVGGAHTDVNAEEYLKQFRGSVPEEHALGTPAPGRKRRVVFLKFWRNIADMPIVNHHLAMLDKSSIGDSNIHEAEINFKGMSIRQNRLNSDVDEGSLNWVYFPHMQRDEIICFQQGDMTMHGRIGDEPPKVIFPESRQDHSTFHGAFVDPSAPSDAPPRQSIEVAAYVFLPEEPLASSKM